MKPTPKTDELIRMISDIEKFISLLNIPIKTEKQFVDLSNQAEYFNLLIKYRLFGSINIDYKGDTSFKKFKGESMPEDFNSFASEKLSLQSSNILEQVLKDYDQVTVEDLKQEFWTIIPSIDKIENSYSLIKIKFKEVFSKFPESRDYNYFKLISDENLISGYKIISRSELEKFLLKVSFIVEHLNTVSERIISAYKGFIIEARPLPIVSTFQQENENTHNLNMKQIALKFVYENRQITRANGDEIAKQFGYNSGEKLFQDFTFFSSTANRKGKPVPCTLKKLKNKILLIESVISLLPEHNQQRAKDEVLILKTILENEYQ